MQNLSPNLNSDPDEAPGHAEVAAAPALAQRPCPGPSPWGRDGGDILIIFLPLMGCLLYDVGTQK